MINVLKCLLPLDQDGWLGEFSGGQEYPLLWKEGEVYLLPLSEEDVGFYKAPGESERRLIEISDYPRRQVINPGWVKCVRFTLQEGFVFMLLTEKPSVA